MAVWNVIEEDELSSDSGLWSSGTFSTAYDHLCIKMLVKSTGTGEPPEGLVFQFNGDTGNNYGMRDMQCTSGTVGYYYQNNVDWCGYPPMPTSAASNANMFGSITWWIPNYTASTAKSILIQSYTPKQDSGNFNIKTTAASWNNSAALTSFVLDMNGPSDFAEKSSYTVYGINGA